MIDASALPFEENLAMSREVVTMAAAAGMGVEAELGRIVGVEDDIFVDARDAHLTEVDEAVRFCCDLDLTVFAPAIGTAHGYYSGEPNVAFDRIEEIYRRTGAPGWPTTISRNRSPAAVPRSTSRHSSNTPSSTGSPRTTGTTRTTTSRFG